MTSKHEPQRSVLCLLKNECAREKRRLKDRERRQKMSLEQRIKHLARRRRNYQLRRLRAGIANLNPRGWTQTSIVTESNGIATAHPGLSKLGSKNEGLEDGAYKLRNFPRRLRLHQIRHLARALNNPAGLQRDDITLQNGLDLISKQNSSTNCKIMIYLLVLTNGSRTYPPKPI